MAVSFWMHRAPKRLVVSVFVVRYVPTSAGVLIVVLNGDSHVRATDDRGKAIVKPVAVVADMELIATIEDAAISPWKEYGFPGLVCGSLMAILFFGFKTWMQERREASKSFRDASDGYREDVKEMVNMQIEAQKETADKFVGLHKEQAAEFRSLHEKTIKVVVGSTSRES